MDDLTDLIRLQAWLSPAFPTGAFAYSQGLEAAVDCGVVSGPSELQDWLTAQLTEGTGWNDAVLLAEAWRSASSREKLDDVLALARALNFSMQRLQETIDQGAAFLRAAQCWAELPHGEQLDQCPLPVAVGYVGAVHEVALGKVLAAYLHGYVSNQIQAALRLMKLGQQGGVAILAELETNVISTAKKAGGSTIDDLGNACLLGEVMSMHHETLTSRIFKS